MGKPENRAGPDREILSAGQATEVSFALPCLNPVVGVAVRAGGTPLPSQRFDMRARLTFIRKEPEAVVYRNHALVHPVLRAEDSAGRVGIQVYRRQRDALAPSQTALSTASLTNCLNIS